MADLERQMFHVAYTAGIKRAHELRAHRSATAWLGREISI